jgi:hypothetical protein
MSYFVIYKFNFNFSYRPRGVASGFKLLLINLSNKVKASKMLI